MAQTTQITIDNQTFPSFRSKLNESLSALNTLNSGTSRPSSAVAGTIWLDTTSATNPTLKFYDGADDISLATIDYSANTVNWLDSSVTLTSPVSISGSASAGAEIRLPEDTDNGSHYVGLKASDSIASDITFTLPSADGTADQVLKTDGSGNLSFTDVSGGTDWQSSIKTSAFTAVAGEGYWINTTSGAVTMTLPASASVGDTVEIVDYARTWGTNNVTINQNSLNFQGYSSPNPVYDVNGQSVRFVYSGTTQGWIPNSDDDVTLETPQNATADILVVAGGGSGGNTTTGTQYSSGGGGAGGYRSFTSETLLAGSTYTIVVGAGGSPVANGSNSSISGTGISYTSAGGGFGGTGDNTANAGANGGSGGGGGGGNGATGGSGNTPSTSPSQGNNGGSGDAGGNTFAGGGGGAGAVGGDHNEPSSAGNGGNGLQNSITGTATYYAGGGGGGAGFGGGGTGDSTGGLGGGGDGSGSGVGQNGTANTGGGAGGSRGTYGVASGGSGVVILRLPTSVYSGTTTGSPTVTTDGTDTVLTFTGSGSYTQ
jgi:hypothetical protein